MNAVQQPKGGERPKSKKRHSNRGGKCGVESRQTTLNEPHVIVASGAENQSCITSISNDPSSKCHPQCATARTVDNQSGILATQTKGSDSEANQPRSTTSKSKTHPNLCTNIPYKEKSTASPTKRDSTVTTETTATQVQTTSNSIGGKAALVKEIKSKFKSEPTAVTKSASLEDKTVLPVYGNCEKDEKPNEVLASSTAVPQDDTSVQKSKAELKAERRALQEAQRAAKQAKKSSSGQEMSKPVNLYNKSTDQPKSSTNKQSDDKIVHCVNKINAGEVPSKTITPTEDQVISEKIGGVPGKSKAELRAERRALQEAQRAAKQAKKEDTKAPDAVKKSQTHVKDTKDTKPISTHSGNRIVGKESSKTTLVKQVKLFNHLAPYQRNISVIEAAKQGIHPAIIQLGLQCAEGILCGSNARCTALVHALIEVVRHFSTPDGKDLSHALNFLHIQTSMKFLESCRPVSVGMKVVTKKVMEHVASLPKDLSETEAKTNMEKFLKTVLNEDILISHDAIVELAMQKITADDVILTYGCSYIVKKVLTAAHKKAKFRVIVVDARPKLEGRNMLRYLTRQGIECTYVLINAVAHVMQEATKVFMGAHAVLANGYVMSRVGSSQVALVAKAFNRPVLVCCETYKFSELVQTDSFVFNELGNPDDLVDTHQPEHPLSEWQNLKFLNILNLYYDVTPPDLVTVIINDLHLVPCTSVPVLLRVKPTKK